MCKVIAVAMQKGGCSKTTVVANLGIGLARAGKKVAVIDADPQGSLSSALGFAEPDDLDVSLATIMIKVINEDSIDQGYGVLHHQEGVDLIPGNIELSGLEVTLANVISREIILKFAYKMKMDAMRRTAGRPKNGAAAYLMQQPRYLWPLYDNGKPAQCQL